MQSITENIIIEKPKEEVFGFISNYVNDIKWREGVLEKKLKYKGEINVGAVSTEKLKFFGRIITLIALVTEYEKNRKISFKIIGGEIPVEGYRMVEETGNGTRLIYHLQGKLDGIYKFFSSIIIAFYKKRIKRDLNRLKKVIENSSF